jgi:hypothetical protein
MRNSFDDVEKVVKAVGDTLDEIPDSVNVLSVFLGIQIILKSYIDTMARGIVLPSEVVTLQRHLDFCVKQSTGALSELDHQWNRRQ